MRWFTDSAYADHDAAAWDRMLDDYDAHVRQVASVLPPDLVRLALEPKFHLHDGRFERVEVDVRNSTVIIVVNAGDLEVGYRRMTMTFTGAHVAPDDLQRLSYAVLAEFRPSRWSPHRSVTEIRAQEVDVIGGGRYTHGCASGPFTSSQSSLMASASPTSLWQSARDRGRELSFSTERASLSAVSAS